jgi:hypothetical protein
LQEQPKKYSEALERIGRLYKVEEEIRGRQPHERHTVRHESGVEYSFVLRPVTIGADEDGDPITTCVLEYCDTPMATTAPKRPDGNVQAAVYEVIKTGMCEVPDVIAESIKGIKLGTGKDRRREYVRRALTQLVANQVVVREGTIVRLPS